MPKRLLLRRPPWPWRCSSPGCCRGRRYTPGQVIVKYARHAPAERERWRRRARAEPTLAGRPERSTSRTATVAARSPSCASDPKVAYAEPGLRGARRRVRPERPGPPRASGTSSAPSGSNPQAWELAVQRARRVAAGRVVARARHGRGVQAPRPLPARARPRRSTFVKGYDFVGRRPHPNDDSATAPT